MRVHPPVRACECVSARARVCVGEWVSECMRACARALVCVFLRMWVHELAFAGPSVMARRARSPAALLGSRAKRGNLILGPFRKESGHSFIADFVFIALSLSESGVIVCQLRQRQAMHSPQCTDLPEGTHEVRKGLQVGHGSFVRDQDRAP